MQFSRKDEFREYFVTKFGIPREVMEKYTFWQRGKKVWAFCGIPCTVEDVEILGIRALKISGDIKPSTVFLRVVGKYATRNVIDLNETDAMEFMRGKTISGKFEAERGYVIIRCNKEVLGCGFYTGSEIVSQIPKEYRVQDSWV